jgi:hypothetical protein
MNTKLKLILIFGLLNVVKTIVNEKNFKRIIKISEKGWFF